MYEIKKIIPSLKKRGRPDVYPFEKMAINECFEVPVEGMVRHILVSACGMAAKRYNIKFSVRLSEDGELWVVIRTE